jgi:hypothetical protein
VFLTLLKIVAGIAVLGVIAMVLVAVVSGIAAAIGSFRRHGHDDD